MGLGTPISVLPKTTVVMEASGRRSLMKLGGTDGYHAMSHKDKESRDCQTGEALTYWSKESRLLSSVTGSYNTNTVIFLSFYLP